MGGKTLHATKELVEQILPAHLHQRALISLSCFLEEFGQSLPRPTVGATDHSVVLSWDNNEHHFEMELTSEGLVEFFYRNRINGGFWGEDRDMGEAPNGPTLKEITLILNQESMFTIKLLNGDEEQVNPATLERLRMLADWQLRTLGYEPSSINAACRIADGE